jgi:hypothetical protein
MSSVVLSEEIDREGKMDDLYGCKAVFSEKRATCGACKRFFIILVSKLDTYLRTFARMSPTRYHAVSEIGHSMRVTPHISCFSRFH